MAVKYVKDFEFPSDFGFHKSNGNHAGGPKGMGAFQKTKAGPAVVTGNKRGTGGGHLTTGKVSKFATGGGVKTGWDQKKGIGKGGNEDRGIGTGTKGEKFSRISDTKSPTGSRHESGPKSGEAPRDDKRASFSKGMDGGYKKGGAVKKASTPQRYAKGGAGDSLHDSGCKCSYCGGGPAYKEGGAIRVAAGKVKDGSKTPWNKDDGVSPGSFKRTPMGEKVTNKKAAYDKFSAEGRNTDPATEQKGSVQRMSEFSDFKKGGKVHKKAKGGHATTPQRYAKGGQVTTQDRYEGYDDGPNGDITEDRRGTEKQVSGDGMAFKKGGSAHRVNNLGRYAHPAKKGGHAAGGDIKVPGTTTERPSGKAGSKLVNREPGGQNAHYESAAGTPGVEEPGQDNYEMESGEAYSMGGLSRGSNPKKMAAIHAKQDHKAMGQLAGVVGALSQGPKQPAAPGMGPAPPGMAPQMGAPPGMAGGAPRMPPMAGGPPMAAEGGSTMHIVHHHINHN
jgi:hypothetical protein